MTNYILMCRLSRYRRTKKAGSHDPAFWYCELATWCRLLLVLVHDVLDRLLLAAQARDLDRRLLLEDVLAIELRHLVVLRRELAWLLLLGAELFFTRVLRHTQLVEVGL